MDIRVLLVLLLPVFATAGSYLQQPESGGSGYSYSPESADYSQNEGNEGGDESMGNLGADAFSEGNAYAKAAASEYDSKAKAVEESAKWFQTLVAEKKIALRQAKKRANLLRTMAKDSLRSAEQYRKGAAESVQASKTLENQAREAESLSKEFGVRGRELRVKMYAELKQYLEKMIISAVAETNANTNLAEVERQRTWASYIEKVAEDMMSEAAKWDRASEDSMNKAKRLAEEAAADGAKAKELDKKRNEVEEIAKEAGKKSYEFHNFELEFLLKSTEERTNSEMCRIKSKYFQMLSASLSESVSNLVMFAQLEGKDKALWEKRTAATRTEAKYLESSSQRFIQNVEKLRDSLKKENGKVEKKIETIEVSKSESE